tara:strand:+ start:529 stop:1299 length:771 start_codon:yes stop_codon:yes gene_type:complete
MIVLFRSCEANLSPGSLSEGFEDKPRWNGHGKLEILRKCYLSIQSDLDKRDLIIVVDDRTTPDTLEWMKLNTKAQFRVKSIRSLDDLRKTHPYPNYHPVTANSCPDLMEYLVEVATSNPDELIYVCEDDYLHLNDAISAMRALYKESNYEGFYVPYDYPDRYFVDNDKKAEIVMGKYGHLRSIPSATLTIATLGKTWLKFKYDLLRSGAFADDTWTWKAFKQAGALCPIPGHATHLQDGCITPVINWEMVYDSIRY